jgi:hypothetical protein
LTELALADDELLKTMGDLAAVRVALADPGFRQRLAAGYDEQGARSLTAVVPRTASVSSAVLPLAKRPVMEWLALAASTLIAVAASVTAYLMSQSAERATVDRDQARQQLASLSEELTHDRAQLRAAQEQLNAVAEATPLNLDLLPEGMTLQGGEKLPEAAAERATLLIATVPGASVGTRFRARVVDETGTPVFDGERLFTVVGGGAADAGNHVNVLVPAARLSPGRRYTLRLTAENGTPTYVADIAIASLASPR